MIIAIDGPSGSGKSTISKILAKKLKISYLDTGAMYRGIAYFALQNNVPLDDEQKVGQLLQNLSMEISEKDEVQQIIINGENVTPYIREHHISKAASDISKLTCVRLKLVELQREIVKNTDSILDGRDIGSFVLPNADFKFYLTASAKVRAIRRQIDLEQKGQFLPLETIEKDIIARDLQDTTREFAPLVVAENAIVVDSSDMTVDQMIDTLLGYICK